MWEYKNWQWVFLPKEKPWPWSMDVRHVDLLYRLMMTGLFTNVLEIGGYRGASTSAFIQAQIDGANFKFTTCDIEIKPTLRKVVRASSTAVLEEKSSLDLINPSYDLIFIDGEHSLRQVSRELGMCLACETKTIFAHDTNSTHIQGCEGPPVMRKILESHPTFQVITDDKLRKGEYTERGFTLATRKCKIYEDCKAIFKEMCDT